MTEKLLALIRGELVNIANLIKGIKLPDIFRVKVENFPEQKINVLVPKIEAPDVHVPDIQIPDVKELIRMLKNKDWEINVPEVKIPEIIVPEIKIPPIRMPSIPAPIVNVPKVEIPRIEIPETIEVKGFADFMKAVFSFLKEKPKKPTVDGPMPVTLIDDKGRPIKNLGGGIGMAKGGPKVVGVENVGKEQVNPATEDKQDAMITALQSPVTTLTPYNIVLVAIDTEYSQAIPAGTRKISFKGRDYKAIRWALASGKVAGPTAPYFTLESGAGESIEGVKLTGKTIYFATSEAGGNVIVELKCWV